MLSLLTINDTLRSIYEDGVVVKKIKMILCIKVQLKIVFKALVNEIRQTPSSFWFTQGQCLKWLHKVPSFDEEYFVTCYFLLSSDGSGMTLKRSGKVTVTIPLLKDFQRNCWMILMQWSQCAIQVIQIAFFIKKRETVQSNYNLWCLRLLTMHALLLPLLCGAHSTYIAEELGQ